MSNTQSTIGDQAVFSRRWWSRLSMSAALSFGCAGLVSAEEIVSNIARGGMLYDRWYEVVEHAKPEQSHPAYPKDKKYAEKPGSNWRCKECHGWDYRGKDGAYSSGKHATGIIGMQGLKGVHPSQIISVMKNDTHRYDGKMSDEDFQDPGAFCQQRSGGYGSVH